MIPILFNHDLSKPPIGRIFSDNCHMYAEFVPNAHFDITQELIFEIFGNTGFRILDYDFDFDDGIKNIKKIEIFEWSLSPIKTR